MRASIELALENLVHTKEKGLWLTALLTLPSTLFKWGICLRNWAYEKGILPQKRVEIPVVSIGNIVAGGVGKTSLTYLIARELIPFGKVAILTSGYRSSTKEKGPIVVSLGNKADLSWERGGDEACLLAHRLPEAIVISGRNRFASAELAWLLGAQICLMDDGLQHRQLFRDFEIIVVDGKDPLGGGHFLPRGLLRDHPSRLSEADLMVTVGQSGKGVRAERKIKEICFTNGSTLATLKGKSVGLFCGIGNPESFVQLIESQGACVVASRFFPDHRVATYDALQQFASEVKGKKGEFLLCTEKDWVKIAAESWIAKLPLALAWLKSDLEIVDNRECFESAIQTLKNRLTL